MLFSLALLAGAVSAAEYTGNHYGVNHGSGYGFGPHHGNHSSHAHGHNHKNPWYHTVVHHKSTQDYELDPWVRRNGADADRTGWYSPYQQFSPAQIQYVPTVTHATFARCAFSGGSIVLLGQLKGKAPVVKYDLTGLAGSQTAGTDLIGTYYQIAITEFGTTGGSCTRVGEEYNPLKEVDKYGRENPFQDPMRGRLPPILNQGVGTTTFISEYPENLLQNLEGKESIIGRGMVRRIDTGNADGTITEGSIQDCCTIARDQVPEGFGPKPVPYPLTTHSHTYASYGTNYAVPTNNGRSSYSSHPGGHSYGRGYYSSAGYH